ncbi:uncharacterized protein LOC133180750 [Saccostrea echinata]|uniref:uncharacterized protein LOC133180750 n=1 Tax=Saccostrea echinata TaxID=191078 RepID=UPI002A7F3F70|nr:uncharacterized protein LOC133180750 [Saccostrea echinata]
MSTPVLHKSITVTDVNDVRNISRVSSDRVWMSDGNNLILTNTAGDTLHHLTNIDSYYGEHTVNNAGDLIYIDKDHNINKLSTDNRSKSILIKKTKLWKPLCVYCSRSNRDLLVGMWDYRKTGKVNRYNNTGQHIQTIQHNSTGQKLYKSPAYITENRNDDVIVSDLDKGIVVTEHEGKYRFTYAGPPSGSGLAPLGICTDALSHILVCDRNTQTLHMINKDGYFLSLIQTRQHHGIFSPWSLNYDYKTHLLWVRSWNDRVCVYRYINRQDYLTGN